MNLHSFTSSTDFHAAIPLIAGNTWLLLDGARFEDILMFIYKLDPVPEYFALYKGTEFEPAMKSGPFLLRITPEQGKLWSWFIGQGVEKQSAMLLVSSLSLPELVAHFQQYLEARLPNLDVVLFRFYDPSIFHILATQSFREDITAMLNPCSAVYWHNKNRYHCIK